MSRSFDDHLARSCRGTLEIVWGYNIVVDCGGLLALILHPIFWINGASHLSSIVSFSPSGLTPVLLVSLSLQSSLKGWKKVPRIDQSHHQQLPWPSSHSWWFEAHLGGTLIRSTHGRAPEWAYYWWVHRIGASRSVYNHTLRQSIFLTMRASWGVDLAQSSAV